MITYVARAVPWRLAAVVYLVVALAMSLVGGWPDIMWPLEGAAVGLLAGITAWAQDEPCAAVVDTLPRSLMWRLLARSTAAGAAVAVWLVCLVVTRHRLPPHLAVFALEGVTAVVAALALVGLRRSRGEALPGRALASMVVPGATALALTRPTGRWLPLFPIWPQDDWSAAACLWLAVGGVALAALVALVLRESRAGARLEVT